jgi:hypothetical protein
MQAGGTEASAAMHLSLDIEVSAVYVGRKKRMCVR